MYFHHGHLKFSSWDHSSFFLSRALNWTSVTDPVTQPKRIPLSPTFPSSLEPVPEGHALSENLLKISAFKRLFPSFPYLSYKVEEKGVPFEFLETVNRKPQ